MYRLCEVISLWYNKQDDIFSVGDYREINPNGRSGSAADDSFSLTYLTLNFYSFLSHFHFTNTSILSSFFHFQVIYKIENPFCVKFGV